MISPAAASIPQLRAATATDEGAASPSRKELHQAAQAFEAIMIRRMLASARAANFAKDTYLSGDGLSQFETLRDENYAELASKSGAFGIAQMIERQLAVNIDKKEG